MVILFLALTILINEVMPAPTNASEWVELYNPGSDPINISGWYLDDDTAGGTQIIIPADTVIDPATLHVITLSSAILNNTGDAITLYDATGQLIDRIDFGTMKSSESLSRMPDGSTIIIKTPPSPGQLNDPSSSPSAQPTTATPTGVSATATTTPSASTPTEPVATHTLSETHTMAPTPSPLPSRTASPTITESTTNTPSPTKTPSETRTPSPTKTPSMSKTPSNTPLVSATRTLSFTRTMSATKTISQTRTPRPSQTPKRTQTPSHTKTPRLTRTPIDGAPQNNPHASDKAPTTLPIIAITGKAQTPQLVVCPPPPSSLNNWDLRADGHHIALPDSADCVTIDLPTNPPTHWQLTNPHGLVVATIDVFAAYCAHDMSNCQPSPTMAQQPLRVEYQRPQMSPIRATVTPQHTDIAGDAPTQATRTQPPTTAPSTIPLGMLLMLGGWIALKMLARPAPDVLYSEADEDAASSADSLSSESRKV